MLRCGSGGCAAQAAPAGLHPRLLISEPEELLCPAFELLEAAKATNRLHALDNELEQLKPADLHDARCRAVLRFLVRLSQGGGETPGLSEWQALVQLAGQIDPLAPARERCPELLACRVAVALPWLRPQAEQLLETLSARLQDDLKNKVTYPEQPFWERLLRREYTRCRLAGAGELKPLDGASSWKPVGHATAEGRAAGFLGTRWYDRSGEFIHVPNLCPGLLYYPVPLRGDFTVECELSAAEGREAQLVYASSRLVPQRELKRFTLFNFGRLERNGTFVPPLEKLGDWYGYKLQVKGGALTASINGRKVHESRLAVDADPWLAIFSDANQAGGVRQLKITGSPSVPEVIELSRHSTLHAWLPEYYAENVINRTQGYSEENMPIGWDKKGEEIVGTRWSQDGPPKTESILRYHRPLLEDGQLDYEFYYEPGKTLTHPALDRLVFLLDKEGVKVHWLTHGGWHIGGPSPENATAEPDTRRGTLTLKESAWNQMTLVLKGDRVTLRLNGQDIAERKLDPGNSRHFGLFHYSDETLVRVRNVRLRGEWPRQLPGAATAHK